MAKVKSSTSVTHRPKPKRKLGRHTKHINKHKSWKPNRGQG
jgi:hypothetical protein